ncbi:phosphate signaling complex protein PhoU [Solwaraspora sp. WMMD1047]|uniref:phosphate signaling complex protein PhoU n=1 Tax=Solwaraspora sp. WMMD1047 TaxID=3016102 RepID=UPI002415AA66|nr:phosphate signaling complex protein PhoU [Solwaraspora sp. WMMD1047]MDG4833616.1 phosphate signaling complex protein PhoU [Solwaraspora sp. WMMD1047]
MRDEFQADLNTVNQLLVEMAEAVRAAMSKATHALLTADKDAATEVLADDAVVDQLYLRVEELVCDLLARQAPVATDLRTVVTALHVAADLERMGDLADHVAKTALRRHPLPAVPAELRGAFGDMAEVADRIAQKIAVVLSKPDVQLAAELDQDDDAMDNLHRELFVILLDDAWPYGVETGIDGALLGRFYERFADHAVNAGRRVVYLITGEIAREAAGGFPPPEPTDPAA